MKIENIQIEEGFLDGFSLDLADGLNVLIGPRGAGKTSVIELLRFCLDSPTFSEKSQARAREHALSVLGSGQVTVKLSSGGELITVTRSGDDQAPRASAPFMMPMVFSQNEIETIGLQAVSRLRLIDEFRPAKDESRARSTALRAEVRSLTSEIRNGSLQIAEVEERLRNVAELREKLAESEQSHKDVVKTIGDSEGRWSELDALNSATAELSVREAVFERVVRDLGAWQAQAQTLLRAVPTVEDWPEAAGGTDPLVGLRSDLGTAIQHLRTSVQVLSSGLQSVALVRAKNREEKVNVEEKSRVLRRELEQLQKGGSAITKTISGLREEIGKLDALAPIVAKKKEAWNLTVKRRDALLNELDSLCEKEYDERKQVADHLNSLLGPMIRVSVERFGIQTEYVNAIRSVLRGTGIHYNTLAPLLAERMSPREVLDAVESQDHQTISDVAGIPLDRAARLVSELSKVGAEELVTCELQDSVTLCLLDGGEYKDTEHLSTGQRCTVILPVLLAKEDRVLVIDQPEDHLDNGFIVGTAIEAIRTRQQVGQLLFSTHNPNVPVLGEASRVVLMGSDGQHGFVRHAGPLDHPVSVDAITTIMEGGLAAFHRRAEFYGDQVPS